LEAENKSDRVGWLVFAGMGLLLGLIQGVKTYEALVAHEAQPRVVVELVPDACHDFKAAVGQAGKYTSGRYRWRDRAQYIFTLTLEGRPYTVSTVRDGRCETALGPMQLAYDPAQPTAAELVRTRQWTTACLLGELIAWGLLALGALGYLVRTSLPTRS
jgi:hypothetical protein